MFIATQLFSGHCAGIVTKWHLKASNEEVFCKKSVSQFFWLKFLSKYATVKGLVSYLRFTQLFMPTILMAILKMFVSTVST